MDLIDRQAALACFHDWIDKYGDVHTADEMAEYRAIEALPSAQPEIIRCKECRYYEWMSNRVPDEQTWFCHNWNAETGKDDFCSYAERRTDGKIH